MEKKRLAEAVPAAVAPSTQPPDAKCFMPGGGKTLGGLKTRWGSGNIERWRMAASHAGARRRVIKAP